MEITQKYADELRTAAAIELEAKADSEGRITGWASTYGGEPDTYGDIVAPGAYRKSLEEHEKRGTMPVMLWQHRAEIPIGRWLSFHDEKKGLRVNGQLNLKTEAGREAFEHARAGDVGGFSIGYSTPKNGRRYVGDGAWLLEEVDLVEVSLVTLPANRNAVVTGVKEAPLLSTKSEAVRFLRDAGLSKAAAQRFAAGGFPALAPATDAHERAMKLAEQIEQATTKMRNYNAR
ncbi:HK97 family phage prohead protease [Paracoccus onubensis]|uniref:HK97 family phage prohead protease n=1 Tax=Paracoccus onubensis TaxID=1675788 RepID=A0A418SX01_9RHOB|nr:HK97 family phage prohead protease [Paracoccus onubensis]RJE85450.1 HK97 family phage prohead protease [Paracoccus onubensis]